MLAALCMLVIILAHAVSAVGHAAEVMVFQQLVLH